MKTISRIFSIVLAAYMLLESALLQGMYIGYGNMAVKAGIYYPHIGNMLLSDADPHDNLMNLHVYVNWLLILFIASKAIKAMTISRGISAILSMFLFLAIGFVYLEKIRFLHDDNSYLDLLRSTITYDLTQLWLSGALLGIEILSLIILCRENWRKKDTGLK